jgi:heme/copper-type cytochrome/quinol oxidase subunit 1
MAIAAASHAGVANYQDHIHPEPEGFVAKYIFSTDAKVIGIQYMVTALLFFIVSGLLAEIVRAQLLTPNGALVSNDTYNGVYSLHGSGMVWMTIIPIVTGGFGNYVMPLMIGQRRRFSVAQPRRILDVSGRRRHPV